MAHRWQVAQLLDEGLPYLEVAQAGARLDDDGDARGAVAPARRGRLRARAAAPQEAARLRIAVPSKGRLREPAIQLLHDAGLGPETPGDRALAFPCRNAPVEALLVRADDVPEYVQDGVVDCGITGLDIVRERGADVVELAAARLRRLHARGGGADRVDRAVARGSARRARRDELPASCARADARRRSSSSTCTARSSSRRGSAWPTRSSTSSRAAARCARTACARSRACSSRKPCSSARATRRPRRCSSRESSAASSMPAARATSC